MLTRRQLERQIEAQVQRLNQIEELLTTNHGLSDDRRDELKFERLNCEKLLESTREKLSKLELS